MGVDNGLAVAGAAHGSFLLVVIGLLVSIPIVMLGSTMILHWVERFPSIILLGAGVLGWTAAKMISAEQAFGSFFPEHHGWRLALTAFCVGIVLLPPLLARVRTRINAEAVCLGFLMVWLACLGWMLATRQSAHIRIRVFQDKLPRAPWRATEAAILLAAALLGATVAFYSVRLIRSNADIEALALPVSTAWLYVPLLPAGIVTVLQALADLRRLRRGAASPAP